MRDKYFDLDGWKKCTLRHNIELGQGLWLLCGTCRKSRYFNAIDWARQHGVDLDTPLKTLGRSIRCRRCGTFGVSAYAQPYDNLPPQPQRHRFDHGPICPACGSDDVHQWPLRLSDYPPGVRPKFMGGRAMEICGCEACDNWWTQPKGVQLR
jgi:hypothetical protein